MLSAMSAGMLSHLRRIFSTSGNARQRRMFCSQSIDSIIYLFNQGTHRQAPHQPAGPAVVLQDQSVERPRSQYAESLAQARRDSDDPIAAHGFAAEEHLPRMRSRPRGQRTQPREVLLKLAGQGITRWSSVLEVRIGPDSCSLVGIPRRHRRRLQSHFSILIPLAPSSYNPSAFRNAAFTSSRSASGLTTSTSAPCRRMSITSSRASRYGMRRS